MPKHTRDAVRQEFDGIEKNFKWSIIHLGNIRRMIPEDHKVYPMVDVCDKTFALCVKLFTDLRDAF